MVAPPGPMSNARNTTISHPTRERFFLSNVHVLALAETYSPSVVALVPQSMSVSPRLPVPRSSRKDSLSPADLLLMAQRSSVPRRYRN
jgi:hypothetical protein